MKEAIRELTEEVKQLKNMIFILSAKVDQNNISSYPVPYYPTPYYPYDPYFPREIWYATSASDCCCECESL